MTGTIRISTQKIGLDDNLGNLCFITAAFSLLSIEVSIAGALAPF
jgi:hypothetical protein